MEALRVAYSTAQTALNGCQNSFENNEKSLIKKSLIRSSRNAASKFEQDISIFFFHRSILRNTFYITRSPEHTLNRPRALSHPLVTTFQRRVHARSSLNKTNMPITPHPWPYEPSLSICLSSFVLWKLISSSSCSNIVGALVKPADDELLARLAMADDERRVLPGRSSLSRSTGRPSSFAALVERA